eukprot:CAMPEP_0168184038 /NCGR_PEP_ID=MMETSP0139_2-20121125/12985_1 /TAXON_ID=44445 /ORGANISM="Pseudo-nitzschia australis, Strain 10249 10 AB" /LENGTH=83 /DNA_ID=CAMNT_0008105551 /DNA_START=273 /DNA_END=524 /DNA_ORIENTATION=-
MKAAKNQKYGRGHQHQRDDEPEPPFKTSLLVSGPFLVQSSVAVVVAFALGPKRRAITDDPARQRVGKVRVRVVGKFFQRGGSN